MFPWLRGLKAFQPGPDDLGAVGGPMDGGNPPPNDTSQNNPPSFCPGSWAAG